MNTATCGNKVLQHALMRCNSVATNIAMRGNEVLQRVAICILLQHCYNHVQLRVLSGYSGRIAAPQLNSGRSPLTPVVLALVPFR